jgi:hypothetical protein
MNSSKFVHRVYVYTLKCSSGFPFDLWLLDDGSSTTCAVGAVSRARRCGDTTNSSCAGNRWTSHDRSHLYFLPAPGGIVALLLSQFLGRGALAVGGHLGLDLHASIEFLFGDATFSLGIAFLLDGVEDTAKFGKPLHSRD